MNQSKFAETAAKAIIGLAADGLQGAALAVAPQVAGDVVEWLLGSPQLAGHEEAWRDQLRYEVRVFQAEREARFRAEVTESIRRFRAEMDARMTTAERAACAYPTIEEVAVLVQQFAIEARRSVLDERVRLMAAAIAGTFRPDVETEMKSRAARALVQLEPSDVISLREIEPESFAVSVDLIASETLLGALCIRQAEVGSNGVGGPRIVEGAYRATEIGRAVLRLVETWKPLTLG